MGSTHTSLHCHIVFSTHGRRPIIGPDVRSGLHAYLGGIVRGCNAIALEVGGVADHVHLLVGLRATHSVAGLMLPLKRDSSHWAVERIPHFAWQEGYGAFAVSRSNVDAVRAYIRNQEEHHRRRSFQEEYREFLLENGVSFDERYLW